MLFSFSCREAAGNYLGPEFDETLARLPNLENLFILGNDFEDEFPTAFSESKSLVELNIEYNRFHGAVGPGLANIPTLKVLVMGGNRFDEPFPPEIVRKFPNALGT